MQNEQNEKAGAQEAEATQEQTAERTQPEGAATETSEVERLSDQLNESNDRLLRTLAEYDNFRKRSQREKDSIYPQATAMAVAKFIPILDTFDQALSAPCTDDAFKKGVEMILHNFKDALTQLGVEEFGAAGDVFNPDLHNAVMHVEDEAFEAGTIAEVFQKGYKLGERVVRHAMVKAAN